jgi:hypothetical protein
MRRIVQRMRHGSLASALRQWHQTLQQLQEHAWAQERRQVCGTSAYASIRQHTSAYVSIRPELQEHAWAQERRQVCGKECGNGARWPHILLVSFTDFF